MLDIARHSCRELEQTIWRNQKNDDSSCLLNQLNVEISKGSEGLDSQIFSFQLNYFKQIFGNCPT